jgi:hypothetical protein
VTTSLLFAVPTCAICGRPYRLQWHVDNHYWLCISGELAHHTLCFDCANELANGLDVGHLDYLAFWGHASISTLIDKPEKRA